LSPFLVKRIFQASEVVITRLVLDRFQDSSKTGSGINFFAAFLAAFFAAFFATFFAAFFCRLFSAFLPVQMTSYFEYAVQKSVACFWGLGGLGGV